VTRLLNVCLTCQCVDLGVLQGDHMVDSLSNFPYSIWPMSGKWPLLSRHAMMPWSISSSLPVIIRHGHRYCRVQYASSQVNPVPLCLSFEVLRQITVAGRIVQATTRHPRASSLVRSLRCTRTAGGHRVRVVALHRAMPS